MFIKLAPDGRVTLEDRDNFRAFKLVIEGRPEGLDAAARGENGTYIVPEDLWLRGGPWFLAAAGR